MSQLVTLSLRVEPATKTMLSDLADEMGASMSAVLDILTVAYLPDAFDHDPDLAESARRLTAERRRRGHARRCDCRHTPGDPMAAGPHHAPLCRMFEAW